MGCGLTVNDVLRNHVEKTIQNNPGWFTPHQQRVLHKLIDCRTAELGCQAFHCGDCGEDAFRYASCHDRHCPTCGTDDRENWRERMLTIQLPVQSLHLVFTLPHEFNPLILANQALIIGIFFSAIHKILNRVFKKDFGCQPGMAMVLHTWGQRMNCHIHCHVLVFAGGPSLDGSRWIDIPTDVQHPIDPQRLSQIFRKQFVRSLRKAFSNHLLTMPDAMRPIDSLETFDAWLAPVVDKTWKVHSQKTPAHCKDARAAIKYLSHYISGTAISNYRILSDDGEYVTIRVKSYRKKCQETLRMTGEEFVKRFAFHILPFRCVRVRYGGCLGSRYREQNLRLCRQLLGVPEEQDEESSESEERTEMDSFDTATADGEVPERYPVRCLRCGRGHMECVGRYDALQTRVLIAAHDAFWARVYTVASTLDDLPFEFLLELPRPET